MTFFGIQSQFSCKKSIPIDMWDVKGNCAKGRSKEALQINRELDNIKAQIIKHYQHLSDREAFVTAEMVRNSYQGFGSEYETLLSAFDKDIANQKKRVGKDRVASTLWAMERSRKDVAEFIQSHYRRTDMSCSWAYIQYLAHVLVVKPLAKSFVCSSTSHCLHLCDEAVKARQQFFDKRSGKPITS